MAVPSTIARAYLWCGDANQYMCAAMAPQLLMRVCHAVPSINAWHTASDTRLRIVAWAIQAVKLTVVEDITFM